MKNTVENIVRIKPVNIVNRYSDLRLNVHQHHDVRQGPRRSEVVPIIRDYPVRLLDLRARIAI